jgi:hypothetical protein
VNCDFSSIPLRIISSDSISCGDGAYYKNIGSISFISASNLDLNQVDDFSYQVSIQQYEHAVYISVNPMILLLANNGDSAILQDTYYVQAIENNQKTADLIQKRIDRFHLDFENKQHYYVLLKVKIKVLKLPNRTIPKSYTSPFGYKQYVILYDPSNRIKAVKVIGNTL